MSDNQETEGLPPLSPSEALPPPSLQNPLGLPVVKKAKKGDKAKKNITSFAKGNTIGKAGNAPFQSYVAKLRQAAFKVLTPEKFAKIIEADYKDALSNDSMRSSFARERLYKITGAYLKDKDVGAGEGGAAAPKGITIVINQPVEGKPPAQIVDIQQNIDGTDLIQEQGDMGDAQE